MTIGIVAFAGIVSAIILGWSIASVQNSAISNCFKLREAQNGLLTGDLKIEDMTDFQLLSLRLPMFTHVGIGGVGPAYLPSFTVLCMVDEELSRRRTLK